ncbi:MAG: hypothetical protein ACM34K_12980 [Bacillota bacterium]
MTQEIIVYFILALAFLIVAYRTFSNIKQKIKPKTAGANGLEASSCGSSGCSGCSLKKSCH